MRRVTLREVAEAAGVSRATAGRVLAGTDRNVHPELARRVVAARDRLGYRGNAAARALRTTSTRSVAVLVPSLRNPYFVQLVEEISGQLARSGRSLLLAESADDVGTEAERIATLLASVCDALLVVPTSCTGSGPAVAAAARTAPVVQIDRWARGVHLPSVAMDDAVGVRLLVDHLRARGARRLLYVGAEETSSSGRERAEAFRALSAPADRELALPSFSIDAGRDAARAVLAAGDLPDAVLCAADVLALGMMSGLQSAGVAVPDDVMIAGFDDTDLLRLVTPRITSVRPPVPEIVRVSLDRLDRPGATPARVLLPPGLEVRGSTRR
ncbi:MAG TPA: LacI family DNA-binding transcriptional regulator [Cellulomonas sp.]